MVKNLIYNQHYVIYKKILMKLMKNYVKIKEEKQKFNNNLII